MGNDRFILFSEEIHCILDFLLADQKKLVDEIKELKAFLGQKLEAVHAKLDRRAQ